MPTYQYKCKECGYLFEVFQSMSAEPIKICPKCKAPVKRLIGPGSGPIFKGTGFYQTDYKNKETSSSSKGTTSSTKGTTSSAKETTSSAKETTSSAKETTSSAKEITKNSS
jgi:putative FmdB family regulatory protein